MANMKKFTRAGIGRMGAHFDRRKDKNGEYIKFGNQDINLERTHLNYNLAKDLQPMPQYMFVNKRLAECECLKRKDVNVMCSWVVTLPQEMNGASESDQKKFFEKTFDFLIDRYGAENCISAYVHLDESQPHMHFAFTPVMFDKEKNVYKFNAKKVCSRHDLQTFHKDLDVTLEKEFGYKTGVLNGKTDLNLNEQQLKNLSSSLQDIQKNIREIQPQEIETGMFGRKKINVDNLVLENSELKKESKMKSEMIENQAERIDALEHSLEDLKLSTSSKQNKKLRETVGNLRRELAAFENKHNNLLEQFQALQIQIANEKESKDRLEKDYNELYWKCDDMERTLYCVIRVLVERSIEFISELKQGLSVYFESIQNTFEEVSNKVISNYKTELEEKAYEEEYEEEYEMEF